MNVIVTVPKDYIFTPKILMTRKGGIACWEMKRLPAQDIRYETIYFVWRGEVRYKANIVKKAWDGIEFSYAEVLKEPRKKMESFRGFRYENPFAKIEDSESREENES